MNKPLLNSVALLTLACGALQAQQLTTDYITFPQSTKLHEYVTAWNGGAGTITVDGKSWEDQEFFTSRVKPRTRVAETGVNLYDFGDKADRRSMWWVPVGEPATQAIQNAVYDSEVFTMWSYLDVWGNWTSPYGWCTGAMADVAHKNGVSVSGVASIPNAGLAGDWATCITEMGNRFTGNPDKLGKFLYYHGCDGLGYNSEFSSSAGIISNLYNLHAELWRYMRNADHYNPVWETIWYDGTTDTGGCQFDTALSGKTNLYKSASMFSNYNWTQKLATGEGNAASVNGPDGNPRGYWWNYAGMNQQGGEPKTDKQYTLLKDAKWSMGWWGAHSHNMFWEGRNAGGSGAYAQQRHYMKVTEQFFGNGPRNPAVKLAVVDNRGHRAFDTWSGVSAFINERSTINHTVKDEPFYTFFNIGNGKFFNWKGERVSNNPWYSLGVQDYMPTWHFWTAPSWLNKNVAQGSTKLDVGFTWDDAYFGGSCLKIKGTTSLEYLHLFKTKLTVANGQKITVRYKLLGGQANINLVFGGMDGSKASKLGGSILTLDEVSDAADKGFSEGADSWVTKTFSVTTSAINTTALNGKAIGIIGLEIANAENLELLLGELSITTPSNTTTPGTPTLRSAKVMKSTYTGVDGKLIWTMDGDAGRQAGTPVYNSDVNTSMFKIYAQEEGGAEEFCGVTTSWAGFAFRATNTSDNKKIRFGVSAVSMDTKTESPIAWSQYFDKGTYTPSNEIEITKRVVKPNEAFTVRYCDPKHPASTWKIRDVNGVIRASATGTEINVPGGLPEVNGYDLIIDQGTTSERTFGYYVQVTDEKVGALPRIDKVTVNGTDITSASASTMKVQLTDHPVLGYEGRACDGSGSRAISLNNGYIGAKIGDLGISNNTFTPFAICGWFYFKEIPDQDWNFMNVSNKTAGWPQNTWGWCWNHGHPDGTINCKFRGKDSGASVGPGELHYSFPDTKLEAGVWTHIAWICDYNSSKAFRNQLYINGVKQRSTWVRYVSGNGEDGQAILDQGTTDDYVDYKSGQTVLSAVDYAYFGGAAHMGTSIDGYVDDFQVWGSFMTADDVKKSMNGLDRNNLPSSVLAFWDFETDYGTDYGFTASGTKAGVKAFNYKVEESAYEFYEPFYVTGCPFLSGTAFPVKTVATWRDKSDRLTQFEKRAVSRATLSEAEGGEAVVTFTRGGDHVVSLTLENEYGVASTETGEGDTQFSFPVFEVPTITAIDGIDADSEGVTTTAEGRTIFFDFAETGEYKVEAFNMAGLCVASEQLNATAGQRATITMGASGIYLIKIVKNGITLRAIKLMVK